MQLIRDLERLLFCDGRWKSLIACINSLVGWLIDTIYHTPRIALGACLAVYFIHGFLVNAVASQEGQHPALLLNDQSIKISETVAQNGQETDTKSLKTLMSGEIKLNDSHKEQISFREFQTAVLNLSRAKNFHEMTPEQTAAITRAALSLQE